jgi:hypothetical protein
MTVTRLRCVITEINRHGIFPIMTVVFSYRVRHTARAAAAADHFFVSSEHTNKNGQAVCHRRRPFFCFQRKHEQKWTSGSFSCSSPLIADAAFIRVNSYLTSHYPDHHLRRPVVAQSLKHSPRLSKFQAKQ